MKVDSIHDEIPSPNSRPGFLKAAKRRLAELFADGRHDGEGCDGCTDLDAALNIEEEVFRNLMEMANEIARKQPAGLNSLIAAILRPLQAEQMLSVAERSQHAARAAVDLSQLFSTDYFFSFFDKNDCLQLPAEGHRLNLSRDIVLTTPWHRDRFASALVMIGSGKESGPWRQDPNHSVALVLPWRFGIVDGGNHSIAAGVLGQEGELSPSYLIDLSPLLARVSCDGRQFVCSQSGRVVAKARNGRMAALFEIGKMISQSSGEADSTPAPGQA